MRNLWSCCLVGVLALGAASCEKSDTETLTQSAKAASAPAAEAAPDSADEGKSKADDQAKPSALGGTAAVSQLKEGDPAPAVELTLHDGETVSLASLVGKPVVLYFYPMDDTPGCTVEAQGIRDSWAQFEEAGIKVFGVSMQDAASHQSFIAKHKLPFPLVVDSGAVTQAFGVPVAGGKFASRHSFLIDAQGKVAKIWLKVDPAKHAQELLEAASAS